MLASIYQNVLGMQQQNGEGKERYVRCKPSLKIVPGEYVSSSSNNSCIHCIFELGDRLIHSPLLLWMTKSNPMLLQGGYLLSIVPYLLHPSPHPQHFAFLRPVCSYKNMVIVFSLLILPLHLILSVEGLFPSQSPGHWSSL